MGKVVLKEGKERPVLQRHRWVFSGAIASMPKGARGELLPLYAVGGELLGHGYFSEGNSLAGRMVSFGEESPWEAMRRNLASAFALRRGLFRETSYRWIHGEADGLPGLVVDRYGETLVVSIGTRGMERLKGFLVEELCALHPWKGIYEKSLAPARRQEGLEPFEGVLYGAPDLEVEIVENGHRFLVSLDKGQKTGFYFDQREMRRRVGELAEGRHVLNGFAFTGGFSVYALQGGALSCTSIESSRPACDYLEKNLSINGIDATKHRLVHGDCFAFFQEEDLGKYDLVILDPPAYAKRRGDEVPACRKYKELNRLVLKKVREGALVLTCSCSAFVGEELFQKVLFQAASEVGRRVRVVGRHIWSGDHPVDLSHPESDYLKSLLLYVG